MSKLQKSRTQGAKLLAMTSAFRQVLVVLLNFISRTLFIRILGVEFLGINGLFSNILSILALSELGIGATISFYLYKPIVEEDIERIKSIMHFYKICYRCVGIFILLAGFACTPFLRRLVRFDDSISINLYLVFMLYILNTAGSYFFYSYKQTLAYANQEGYKIEKYVIIFSILSCITDCIVLVISRDYYAYLIIKFLLVLVKNLYIGKVIDKEYPYICEKNFRKIEKKEIQLILKDVLNISIYKIGSALYSATDNMIISMLIGTMVVGYYSNYVLIVTQVLTLINLIANSFVAGIGNVIAKESIDKWFDYFKEIDLLVYSILFAASLLLIQLLNPFIKLWVGTYDANYILPVYVVWIIVFNFYLDSSILILTAFREASGHFEIGRWEQLIGGGLNIVLSIILGRCMGLAGVFLATSICKMFITIVPIIFKSGGKIFSVSGWKLLAYYFFHTGIMIFFAIVSYYLGTLIPDEGLKWFGLRVVTSLLFVISSFTIIFFRQPEFKSLVVRFETEMYTSKKRKHR